MTMGAWWAFPWIHVATEVSNPEHSGRNREPFGRGALGLRATFREERLHFELLELDGRLCVGLGAREVFQPLNPNRN
jgi:hypothetical protein